MPREVALLSSCTALDLSFNPITDLASGQDLFAGLTTLKILGLRKSSENHRAWDPPPNVWSGDDVAAMMHIAGTLSECCGVGPRMVTRPSEICDELDESTDVLNWINDP